MRGLTWLIAVVIVAAVCWRFPLFHVVPMKRAAEQKAAAMFNPTQFVEKFWTERLLKSLDQAVKAEVLLPALQTDALAARKKFSRSLGVSDSYTYFVSGAGHVVAATDKEISLVVTDGATKPEIALQIGLLFGNTLRDGTGLLNVSDYPNSQDFNGIAAELNHLVETRVLPKLREQVKVGGKVFFVGCAEVSDEATDLHPLRVVPIQAEVQ